MAMILDAFAGKMAERLAEFVEERVVIVLGVKDEVKRLQRRMARIKHVLQDAERKRIQSAAVAAWVRELKDVVYDADDIIDLCRVEGGKLLGDQPSASTDSRSVRCNFFLSSFSCCSSVSVRHEIGYKIKDLNQRLEDITMDMSELNLVIQNEPYIEINRINPRQTSSLVDPSDIVGEIIKHATEELVERIAKKEEGEQKCRVFAITGMGGIGKTTLAQNIFNHQKITSEFSPKIWVCISQNFSDTDLVKEIIRVAGGNHGDMQTRAELLPLLQQIISGKPFFLVLDDVWREDVWVDLLRHPLQSGAIGSRILVTTRHQSVAMQMGIVHRDIHRVKELPLDSGWELLCKSLFSSSQEEEMQNLSDVGVQIVKKCHGLPLAIKAIAGVLRTRNRSKREWEKVLRRDAWSMDKLPDDLRGALYLSYEDLPSHLKQCFVFCSLFPEDKEFYRPDLVNYWVVEGFVETQEDSFLEVADEYFEDLVHRNLVQIAYTTSDGCFKMHDLLRSLAQYLSRDESFCGEAHELATLSTTTMLRRLTITDGKEVEVIPEPLLQQKSLRTLFLRSHPRLGNDLFVRFPFLRLLMLSDSAIDNIPDAVGNLIHLRLLDLDRTKISNLPESIRHLTNLEVLYLSGCRSLNTLPNGITRLCNLWFLDLHGTPLSFIPAGIGSLIQLNILKGFVLGEDSTSSGSGLHQLQGCSLEDLKSLSQLRELSIEQLERTVVAHKGQMVLQNKPHLKMLELKCRGSTVERTNEIEEVFAELFPPPCLEKLKIDGYYGRGFPGWMMSESLGSFLPQLTSLSLSYCTNVLQLPPLGLLPELRELTIRSALAVATMGPEFLGSSATSMAFPKLEYLMINDMDNLEELSFCGEEEGPAVLPHLQQLCIHLCPKLKSLPRGLKQSPLKMLKISDVNLRTLIGGLTDQLVIRWCTNLELISDFPALKELTIDNCPLLKSVEKVDTLKRLKLEQAEDNECLPVWLLRLLQQRQQQMNEQQDDDDFQLQLLIGDKLLKKCLKGCEYWPIIRNIPLVNFREAKYYKFYIKYTKKPFFYDTNL